MGSSLLGNAASLATKQFGGGELAQAGAKGVTFLAGLKGARSALNSRMRQGYETAEDVAKDAIEPAKDLANLTQSWLEKINRGLKTPGKEVVKEALEGVQAGEFFLKSREAKSIFWEYLRMPRHRMFQLQEKARLT